MRTSKVKLDNVARVYPTIFKKNLSFLALLFKLSLFLFSILLFTGLERSDSKHGSQTSEDFGNEFREHLRMDISEIHSDDVQTNFINQLIFQFYSDRHLMPCWTLNFETNSQYKELIALLKSVNCYGLVADDYKADILDSLENQIRKSEGIQQKINQRVKLEKTATQSAFKLLINLAIGLNPGDSLLAINDYVDELPVYLNYIWQNKTIKEGILAIQPQSKQYKTLQKALQDYLQTVKIDTVHYSIRQLQQNDSFIARSLINAGYLNEDSVNNLNSIEVALRNFQRTHCLRQTGKKDAETLEKLGKSTKYIFNLIALNLDRLRKDNLADNNCILVNIPEFRLYYMDYFGKISIYNVSVGKRLTPTPLLSSRIDRIIANPCWNVPRSITINEILPKVQSDSLYLSKHDYSIIDVNEKPVDASNIDWNNVDGRQFNYYLRQQNSENNALGAIKFLFPNQYSVYLHDTPSRNQFNNETRALSHGCVRVQYPEKLAKQLVSGNLNAIGQKLDIEMILLKKQTSEIRLSEPVPIRISYYTCTTDSSGEIFFHPDIYAFDDKAIQNLFATNQH